MNKNILIVGGTSGIGKALVELLQDSNQLFVANRTSEGLNTGKVTHIPFDATSDVLDTTQLPDQLDGFVYCPGYWSEMSCFRFFRPDFSNEFHISN